MSKNKSNDTVKRVAIGATIAAAAGFVAGILTAPKSGKQTRDDIKEATSKGIAEAEKELKKLHTELGKVIDEAKAKSDVLSGKAQQEFEKLVEKAGDTKEKLREVLSAVHEGNAEDADLKRALKDANNALDHLKDYLKK